MLFKENKNDKIWKFKKVKFLEINESVHTHAQKH